MSRKLLFVFNTHAGRKNRHKEDVSGIFKNFCMGNGFQFFIYETTGIEDHAAIKKIIQDVRPNAVIAAGGDGTVNMVGEVMVCSGIPMGIVPMGSANGLARDLNIPKDITGALEVIKNFVPHPIDSLQVNGINCFHVSDFGFNARVVRRFSQSNLRGKISYVWYGLMEFFFFEPFQYIIEAGDQELKGEAFMMTVTNANRFGTNVNINPLGQIDDGYFEISIIKPFSKLTAFKILYRLFHNNIHKSKYNRVIRCKSAVIYNIENTSFHIDGEPAQLQEKIHVNIVPKGLLIFVPPSSEKSQRIFY